MPIWVEGLRDGVPKLLASGEVFASLEEVGVELGVGVEVEAGEGERVGVGVGVGLGFVVWVISNSFDQSAPESEEEV